MSMTVGELTAYLDVDKRGFDSGLDAGERKLRGFGGVVSKMGPALKAGLIGAAAGIGVAVVATLKGSISAASDLNESMSKVNVVFGDSAKSVQDWSKKSATAMGMSRQQSLEAAGTFGNLFVSMGMADDKSAGMSKNLVGLAGDLASFNNIDPAEALDALRSGLVGETEPMRRLGVNMNDATLKAQALKMGISDGTSVLSPAAKAQAAYALILEQTKTAQGDFARTQDGAANQSRIAAAQMTNLKASIGKGLLPAWIGLLRAFNAGVAWITRNWPAIQRVISQVFNAVKPYFVDFIATIASVVNWVRENWDTIGPLVMTPIKVAFQYVKMALKILGNVIRAVMAVIRGDWGAAWKYVKAALQAAWDGMKAIVRTAIDGIRAILTGLGSKILGWIGDLGGLLYDAGKAIITGLWNGIKDKFEDVKDVVTGIGGWISDHKGPLEVDRKLLVPHGGAIMAGLEAGILGGLPSLQQALAGVSGAITVAASPQLALAAPGYGAIPATAAGQFAPPNVYVYLDSEPIAARVEVRQVEKQRRVARASGAFA